MSLVLNRVDIILVGILLGTTEADIYAVASRAAQIVNLGLSASNKVVAPMVAELYATKQTERLQRVVFAACWLAAASVVVLATAAAIGGNWLLGLYGNGFRDGTTVLFILCAAQVVISSTGPVGSLLNMTGHERVNASILLVVVVANAILNFPAILLWGATGAAVVTAVSLISRNFVVWLVVRRRVEINSSIFAAAWR